VPHVWRLVAAFGLVCGVTRRCSPCEILSASAQLHQQIQPRLDALVLATYSWLVLDGLCEGGGESVLEMSTTAFQAPSFCFFQIVTAFPRSIAG